MVMFLYMYARCFGTLFLLPFWEVAGMQSIRFLLPALFAFAIPLEQSTHVSLTMQCLIVELLIGASLTLPLVLCVAVTKNVGAILDSARGSSIAAQYNPSEPSPESILAMLAGRSIFLLLLLSGFLEQILSLLIESVQYLPLGIGERWDIELAMSLNMASFVSLFSYIFLSLLPILFLFLIVEAFIVNIQFLLPGMQLHAEGFLLKSILLLLVLFIALQLECLQEILPWLSHILQQNALEQHQRLLVS